MNLWAVRAAAERYLETEMPSERQLLDRAFQQAEYLAERLAGMEPGTPFSRMTGLVAAKARRLAHACYSLALDALAQESGAVARVWLESIELLTYLRLAPERAEGILNGKLPSAGERAKKINSQASALRKMWNETASHIGFDWNTWRHFFNHGTGQIRARQGFNSPVLRTNLGLVFALMTWTIRETALCLNTAQGFLDEGVARQIDSLKNEGFDVFHPPRVAEDVNI
jgi:hypothetical protein